MALIFETLLHIASKLLEQPIYRTNQKKYLTRLLLFDITEQLFIINMWNLRDIFMHLKRVYESELLDIDGRLDFLLKVKHFNCWILYRVNYRSTNLYETYSAIKDWYCLKINQMVFDVDIAYKWAIDYMYTAKMANYYVPLTFEEKSLLQNLSRSLRQELLL